MIPFVLVTSHLTIRCFALYSLLSVTQIKEPNYMDFYAIICNLLRHSSIIIFLKKKMYLDKYGISACDKRLAAQNFVRALV